MDHQLRREKIASAICGGIAFFALLAAFASDALITPHAVLLVLAFFAESLCLALAPQVLFERTSLKELGKLRGHLRYGGVAVLSVLAKVCLVLAFVFWGLSQLMH